MNIEHIFPVLQAALSGLASIVYGGQGDFGRAIYWIAAMILTLSVTFWVK